MLLMLIGILLWVGIHLTPALTPGLKTKWKGALGRNGYMASFSLLLVLALVLIIVGWRTAIPGYIYTLPSFVDIVCILLMWIASILFIAAKMPTRIKQYIRHPQLLGVVLWAIAHLLANGDTRSVTLFGSMLIWAIIEMFAINHRDGAWKRPLVRPIRADFVLIAVGTAFFLGLIYLHPYLSGVPLLSM